MTWDVPEEAELVESVREHGLFLPVYFLKNEVIDGRKRLAAALATARDYPRVDFDTEREAARFLFTMHPRRALVRFGAGMPATKQAAYFGARLLRIVEVRNQMKPDPPKYDQTPEHRKQLHLRLSTAAAKTLNELKKATRANYGEIVSAALLAAERGEVSALLAEHRDKVRPRQYPRPLLKKNALA